MASRRIKMRSGLTPKPNLNFSYDEFEIVDNLYIERAHQVTRKGGINDNKQERPRPIVTKLLDFKERE